MLHEGLGRASHWKKHPERLASETGFGVFVTVVQDTVSRLQLNCRDRWII